MTATSRSLPARLTREWQVMASRPTVLQRAAQWGLGVPFESLEDLLLATGYRPRRPAAGEVPSTPPPADADGVMAGLVRLAATDVVAARVVLQRLLPGLCAAARRRSARGRGDWVEVFGELVSTAWTLIATYPVDQRPTHVVASLLRTVEHQTFVKPTRRRWHSEATAPHLLDLVDTSVERPLPMVELAGVLADAGATLTSRDRRLVWLLARGHTTAEVAADLEVSVRTLANHRDNVVHRLRAAVAA